eukprot:13594297-Alexandrium_andersonii.AAC.1
MLTLAALKPPGRRLSRRWSYRWGIAASDTVLIAPRHTAAQPKALLAHSAVASSHQALGFG